MKDTETRRTTTIKKGDEAEGELKLKHRVMPVLTARRQGLPRAASWANKSNVTLASAALHNNTITLSQATRQARRVAPAPSRQGRSGSTTTPSVAAITEVRKRSAAAKASSQTSSRPATPASLPARPMTPATARTSKVKEVVPPPPPPPPRSPTSSVAVDSDAGSVSASAPRDVVSPKSPPPSAKEVPSLPPGLPAVPPGLSPVVPPGLAAPPGLPPPVSRTASEAASPQIPVQSSQSSYQMSTQAQALMEDLCARRESSVAAVVQSPFPEIDRMLQSLGNDTEFGGFSFNLDPKLAGDVQDDALNLPDFDVDTDVPFNGGFFDVFPNLRPNGQTASSPLMAPPGIPLASAAHRQVYDPLTGRGVVERQSTGSSYTGSFNPFGGDGADEVPSRKFSPLDEERKVSRFGFARGRQGSASSSMHAASPLGNADSLSQLVHHSNVGEFPAHAPQQWPFPARHPDFVHYQTNSTMSSPLAQHMQPAQHQFSQQPQQPPQMSRFQSFDSGVSEQQLRDLIMASRERANVSRNGPMGRASRVVYV